MYQLSAMIFRSPEKSTVGGEGGEAPITGGEGAQKGHTADGVPLAPRDTAGLAARAALEGGRHAPRRLSKSAFDAPYAAKPSVARSRRR